MFVEITPLSSDAKSNLFLRRQPQKVSHATADMWILGIKMHFQEKLKLHTSVGLNKSLKIGQQF
jgi:hypothetical protein